MSFCPENSQFSNSVINDIIQVIAKNINRLLDWFQFQNPICFSMEVIYYVGNLMISL